MQPVAVRSTVSCIVCSFLIFIVDAIDVHIIEAYSSIGFVMDLYVESLLMFVILGPGEE